MKRFRSPAFLAVSLLAALVANGCDDDSPSEQDACFDCGPGDDLARQLADGDVPDGDLPDMDLGPSGPARFYTAHVMVNELDFRDDMTAWVGRMKTAGYNLIWAHLDDYSGNYVPTLAALMDAAHAAGIPVMPGTAWWIESSKVVQLFNDTWSKPALFKLHGKPVYSCYDYQPSGSDTIVSAKATLDALATAGYPLSTYSLWVNTRFPYSFDNGVTWEAEYVAADGYTYFAGRGIALDAKAVPRLFDLRPQLDGIVSFAVDTTSANIVTTNAFMASGSAARGKLAMAGVSAFYASVSFHDFGFDGAAKIWDGILASKPDAVSDTTADDYTELTYMSPLVSAPTDGIALVPAASAGFVPGPTQRYALTDHGGIQKFLRPWADAFLQGASAPTFVKDRIFAWYYLHPSTVTTRSAIPASLAGVAAVTQSWWNTTIYATGAIMVGGQDQVSGIKALGGMDRIRMAAHLTSAAKLRINGTESALFPAGPAYFEIPLGAFRGKPSFAIVRAGAADEMGAGPQAITDDIYPGAFNFLAVEIDY